MSSTENFSINLKAKILTRSKHQDICRCFWKSLFIIAMQILLPSNPFFLFLLSSVPILSSHLTLIKMNEVQDYILQLFQLNRTCLPENQHSGFYLDLNTNLCHQWELCNYFSHKTLIFSSVLISFYQFLVPIWFLSSYS